MSIPQNPLNPSAPAGPSAPGAVNWGDLMAAADNSVGAFAPLPNGTYQARVEEASDTTTQTGKTMFKVTFVITEGEFANRKVWSNLTVSPESPKALGIFFSQMAALGLDQAYFATGPTPAAIAQRLLGSPTTLTLSQREWSGTIRNEVKGIRPAKPGTGGGRPGQPQPGVPAAAPVAAPGQPPVAPAGSPF